MISKRKSVLLGFLFLVLVGTAACAKTGADREVRDSREENIRSSPDGSSDQSVSYKTITYEAYEMDAGGTRTGRQPTEKDMADTIYKIQKRLEAVTKDAVVYEEEDGKVSVDIPEDIRISKDFLEQLGKPGTLNFILYSDLKTEDGKDSPDDGEKVVYDSGKIVLTGDEIGETQSDVFRQEGEEKARNIVNITFTPKGARAFADITGDHVSERLAIVYNNTLITAPMLQEPITDGKCQISGNFTKESAEQLASTIRIGAMPLELELIDINMKRR